MSKKEIKEVEAKEVNGGKDSLAKQINWPNAKK
jgi:hypothetical protein